MNTPDSPRRGLVVIEAAHRGLNVEVLADATGALAYENAAGRAEAEEIHRAFTVVFHARFGAVTSTAQWIDAVARGAALPRGQLLASARLGHGSAEAVAAAAH